MFRYGGVGGQGGDVCVVASENESLSQIIKKYPTRRITAGPGTNSHVNYILGPSGESFKIEVPIGVTVYKENGKLLGNYNYFLVYVV